MIFNHVIYFRQFIKKSQHTCMCGFGINNDEPIQWYWLQIQQKDLLHVDKSLRI